MKIQVCTLALVGALAGCDTMGPMWSTSTNQQTAAGAAAGAAIGALASDDDPLKGALIGGTVGAVAGTLIGRAQTPGDCVYRDGTGRQYVARC